MDNCIRKLLKMADEGFKFDENWLGEDVIQLFLLNCVVVY